MASDNNWIIPPIYEEGIDIETCDGPRDIEADLERFRQQWCSELASRPKQNGAEKEGHAENSKEQYPSIEEEARYLFLQGVHAERCHRLYEAIQYYRRAVQLVPDIEFRIDDFCQAEQAHERRRRNESETSESSNGAAEEEDEEDLSNLALHFSKMSTNTNSICKTDYNQSICHISDLPAEVIQYILKWVVSNDLDVVSLESVAMVSRGFYLAARDEELWKNICYKVWGANCGSPRTYGSWRGMYLMRPHVRFHGCYISRMSYYRQGERSLDNFYKPFHLVEYFRYVRFFPEGKIVMWSTPEEPHSAVAKLKSRHVQVQGGLTGYYKMAGDQITAVLTRMKTQDKASYRYKRSKRNPEKTETIFCAEFKLVERCGGRTSQLNWLHYSNIVKHKSTGQETTSEFELNDQTYPRLIFSRVRSFTSETGSPLTA